MKTTVTLAAIALLSGCAATNPLPARLYDLTEPAAIDVQLTNFRAGHGAMSAEMSGEERLVGDYTLSYVYSGPKGERIVTGDIAADNLKWGVTGSVFPGKDDPSWQEVFGYSKNTYVTPVGVGTMVGDKGTVLVMVFFYADAWNEVGSGVARSSAGHWYRFHVGVNPVPGK